ncbi:MAG TPA: polymer-forming cytoskeletal protein [Blastocatellia bacterium]|jgi:cytoskeletal protein CcmA (bactofilin family)|nr:polymer-forming cytoskeletal protein [Blastocatellia bacterium]
MKLVKNDKNGSDYGLIGHGIKVSGDISFADQLQVEGKVVGKVTSPGGTLVIGETGELEAQVDVGICVIHGALYGDLIAKARVEIRKNGKVSGDVITPTLVVEEGAVFNGAIRMGQDAIRKLEEVPLGDAGEAKRKFGG